MKSVPSKHPEESDLVVGLKAGEPGAFQELVRLHLPGARRLAEKVLGAGLKREVDDVVQEAFLMALRGIGGFKGDSKIGTWLHRVVVNAALMERRKRRPDPTEEIDHLLPRFTLMGAGKGKVQEWSTSALDLAARSELRGIVRSRIEELPESYRIVVLLRDIEQLNTRETATILEVSESVVKTRLHRARQALRSLLAPYMGSE